MSEKLGRIQWGLMTAGAFGLILPMLGLGLEGMRRRVAVLPVPDMRWLHVATAVGGFLIFVGLVILAFNLVRALRHGPPSGPNPWESRTLEWQTSSPPPEENFEEIPQVVGPPYGYGVEGSRHAIFPGREQEGNPK